MFSLKVNAAQTLFYYMPCAYVIVIYYVITQFIQDNIDARIMQ